MSVGGSGAAGHGCAGALYSTVEDLYLWEQALYTEKLVSFDTIGEIYLSSEMKWGVGEGS